MIGVDSFISFYKEYLIFIFIFMHNVWHLKSLQVSLIKCCMSVLYYTYFLSAVINISCIFNIKH